MSDTPPAPAVSLSLKALLAINSPTRWGILSALAGGEALMVSEIALRSGTPPDAVSKQLRLLQKAGVVINPRVRLYEIAPQFLADKTQGILDFGWCVFRTKFGK